MRDPPKEVIRRCRRRDPNGFKVVYDAYRDDVFRLCLGMLGQDADDAVHDVFLRLFEQVGKYSGRARFGTWLYRLTLNHCLNALKARDRKALPSLSEVTEDILPVSDAVSPFEAAAQSEQCDSAEELLCALSAEHRSVFVLREVVGLTYAEAADVLEVPIGTVMSRLSRARGRLDELISEHRLRLRQME